MAQKPGILAPALLAAALAGPGAALGQTLVDATDVEAIATIARDYGTAEVDKDSTGDPLVTGEMGGTNYAVFFYGCTDGADCQTIQFYAYWVLNDGIDVDSLNTWNREKRFAKAYLDDEGDPTLEYDVNLYAGVSETNLSDTFDWWRVVMEAFEEHIGFVPAEEPVAPEAADAPVVREAEGETPPAATGAPAAIGMGQGAQAGGSKVKVNR